MKNYWCYRIDTSQNKFFMDELNNGRLRQGWGWDKGQNLTNLTVDEGARRNLPMFSQVKKGDILLIPQLPTWGQVALVEATEDWNQGYKFEIDINLKDYGHIFPAKFLKSFTRQNENVTGPLRSTLKSPSRFWNIKHYQEDVEKLLSKEQDELEERQDFQSRLTSLVGTTFTEEFKEQNFKDKIYAKCINQFQAEEWEYPLQIGLQELFPFYQVERVGGPEEENHGTDILIKLPGLLPDYQYAIAIQVKDHEGVVDQSVIEQINKADEYWKNKNLKLIEKWVIITKALKNENSILVENDSDVKILFVSELKELLSMIAKNMIGIK